MRNHKNTLENPAKQKMKLKKEKGSRTARLLLALLNQLLRVDAGRRWSFHAIWFAAPLSIPSVESAA